MNNWTVNIIDILGQKNGIGLRPIEVRVPGWECVCQAVVECFCTRFEFEDDLPKITHIECDKQPGLVKATGRDIKKDQALTMAINNYATAANKFCLNAKRPAGGEFDHLPQCEPGRPNSGSPIFLDFDGKNDDDECVCREAMVKPPKNRLPNPGDENSGGAGA